MRPSKAGMRQWQSINELDADDEGNDDRDIPETSDHDEIDDLHNATATKTFDDEPA